MTVDYRDRVNFPSFSIYNSLGKFLIFRGSSARLYKGTVEDYLYYLRLLPLLYTQWDVPDLLLNTIQVLLIIYVYIYSHLFSFFEALAFVSTNINLNLDASASANWWQQIKFYYLIHVHKQINS